MVDYDTYGEFRDPVAYDLECDAYDLDLPLIEQWTQKAGGPLLDLGCGTARMSIHMAKRGYDVTGVDLIPEMIAHGKQKAAAAGVDIELVVADARDFHLGKQYAFVFMLMHVFQFLYTREDLEAMFACVREHLLPDGYFLFITRNPNPANLTAAAQPEEDEFIAEDGGRLTTINQAYYDPMTQIQHYTRHSTFHAPNGEQTEQTMRVGLRYVYPQELEALLHYNGFRVDTVYGSWKQDPLTAESPSMIYVCQKQG